MTDDHEDDVSVVANVVSDRVLRVGACVDVDILTSGDLTRLCVRGVSKSGGYKEKIIATKRLRNARIKRYVSPWSILTPTQADRIVALINKEPQP
jgi:hypothetical protein